MEAVLAVVGMGVLQLEDKVLDLLGVDRQAVDLEEGKQAVGLEEADHQDKALDLLGDMEAVGLAGKEGDLHHSRVHLEAVVRDILQNLQSLGLGHHLAVVVAVVRAPHSVTETLVPADWKRGVIWHYVVC